MTGKNLKGFEIKVFEKQKVSDEFITEYFNLIHSIWKEMHPLEPLPSIDSMKQHFFEPIPNKQTFSWIAYKDKKLVGSCDLVIEDKNSPLFNERKNKAQFWMNIQKEYRRKGFGTELLRTIVNKTSNYDFIEELGLTGATPLNESIAFCEHFGGEVIHEANEIRVYLKDLNWSNIDEMNKSGYNENTNLSIETFDDIPETILHDYAKAFTEIRNECSYNETPIEKRITPEKLRNFEEKMKNDKIKWIHFLAKKNNGNIIAIADLRYHLVSLERINEAYLGIRSPYQESTVKELLRSEILLHIKKNFPKVIVFYIWFEHPIMNSLNKKIGFTKHFQGKNFKFIINELKTKL